MLKKLFSKGSIVAAVGGFAANHLMKNKRQRWEKAQSDSVDAILDQITAYDIARGAGRLLTGWLRHRDPELSVAAADKRFRKLLQEMDKADASSEERALSRFVLSKVLFVMEGFHLKQGYYEDYQQQARYLIRRNPKWRNISRQAIFKGEPFEPESIIGTTHRLLLLLSDGNPPFSYLSEFLEQADLRDDADYFCRLIALTVLLNERTPELAVGESDEQLSAAILNWFEEYRDFKLSQTGRQEAMLNTGIAAATGGLPTMAGMDLAGRLLRGAGRAIFKRKPKKV